MIAKANNGWQLVLADLALILFLVTLTALVNTSSAPHSATTARATHVAPTHIAQAQALFRPTTRGPTLAQWLSEQPRDPRTTLTIIAQHTGEDRSLLWDNAQTLANSAARSGVAVRVVITTGDESDLYASLAYDEPGANLP